MQMTDQEILEKVSILLKDIYGYRDIQKGFYLNPWDVLSEDNDIFFEAYKKEFGIDMREFNYYKFFYEDQFVSMNMARGILRVLGLQRSKKPKITIEHLIKVATCKKWFDPGK